MLAHSVVANSVVAYGRVPGLAAVPEGLVSPGGGGFYGISYFGQASLKILIDY